MVAMKVVTVGVPVEHAASLHCTLQWAAYSILSMTPFTDEEPGASILKLGGCVNDFSRKKLDKGPEGAVGNEGNEASGFF